MEKCPSSEANSHSSSYEIPRLVESEGPLLCSQEPTSGASP